MPANFSRLLPWLIASILLACLALYVQSALPGNVVAVSIYKAHLCSLGGWIGYWLDRGLFPYDRPHEYHLDEVPDANEARAAQVVDHLDCSALEGICATVQGLSPYGYPLAMIRRAIIVAAVLLCMGLGA